MASIRFAVAAALLLLGVVARGDALPAAEPRTFAAIDISDPPAAAGVRARIERQAAARGLTAPRDPAVRKALLAAESPDAVARRLGAEARGARERGDCETALARAGEAEETALTKLGNDEARQPARIALTVELACEDALGHAEAAGRAAARLRQLVTEPPDGVPRTLWDRYAQAQRPAKPVEIAIDSDPPNARVSVNFHHAGMTPLTLEVPAGEVLLQVEKDGYQKYFRRLTAVGPAPERVSVALVERRRDRTGEIVRRVLALRGSDPSNRRSQLAQISQLARVDVLAAFAARESGATTVWWFDAERGDFLEPPTLLDAGSAK